MVHKDKKVLDVICYDNSMGSNREYFKVGNTYKATLEDNKGDKTIYTIYTEKIIKGVVKLSYLKMVTGTLNGTTYFCDIKTMRNKNIDQILY